MKTILVFALVIAFAYPQDPIEIATHLEHIQINGENVENMLGGLRYPPLKKCCSGSLSLSEQFQRISSVPGIEYHQTKSSPFPGFYSLLASGTTGIKPWLYHQCPREGRHLYVNGMNTNWNDYYRTLYANKISTSQKGQYRLCFSVRNLPTSNWDAKPFGYIQLTGGLLNYWRVDTPTLVGCNWQEIVSDKFSGFQNWFKIWLYNGWFNDGNDLVLDNIRLVTLNRIGIININSRIINNNGLTYSLVISSPITPPSGCIDAWRVNQNRIQIAGGTVVPRLGDYIFVYGLRVNIYYTIQIRRTCQCLGGTSTLRSNFIVYGWIRKEAPALEQQISPDQAKQPEGQLIMSNIETSTSDQKEQSSEIKPEIKPAV